MILLHNARKSLLLIVSAFFCMVACAPKKSNIEVVPPNHKNSSGDKFVPEYKCVGPTTEIEKKETLDARIWREEKARVNKLVDKIDKRWSYDSPPSSTPY